MGTTLGRAARTLAAVATLLIAGCGDALVNLTAPLGGAMAGERGSVQVLFINNTPQQAVFTVGSHDQTNSAWEPDFEQFGLRDSGRVMEGDGTSDILSIECARVLSIGGPRLIDLIEDNLHDESFDEGALIAGVDFFDPPAEDDEADEAAEPVLVGSASAFEALLGVDFPCNSLLIVRFEVEPEGAGPDPFRVDFELIPSDSIR